MKAQIIATLLLGTATDPSKVARGMMKAPRSHEKNTH